MSVGRDVRAKGVVNPEDERHINNLCRPVSAVECGGAGFGRDPTEKAVRFNGVDLGVCLYLQKDGARADRDIVAQRNTLEL